MKLNRRTSYANIVEWTLGAVLYEDELAAIEECDASKTGSAHGHRLVISLFSLITLLCIRHRHSN